MTNLTKKQALLSCLLTLAALILWGLPSHAQPLPAVAASNDAKTETAGKAVVPADLLKTIAALEERLRQLEEKLTPPNTATVAQSSDDLKKEVATLKDEVKKTEGLLGFLREVEVSGIVDGYYSYNNNKVDLFTQGRAFDVRHNAFSLQLAKITLEKKNSREHPLGFRVDVGLGETVDRIISVSDASRNDATKHVLQAYASYVAPIGHGLTLEFGKFYTPVGAEVIETKDNFN
ncbi:MAG: outer membrane beta-barrel protein, partial [Blastocatellia bacterium]